MKHSSETRIAVADDITGQFIFLAQELSDRFPDLDLRFNLKSGSQTLRFMVASISHDLHEIPLGDDSDELLFEAIFSIKEIAQLFDD